MEKNMENEMETRATAGMIWGYIGIIIGILILRTLKGGGLSIMGVHEGIASSTLLDPFYVDGIGYLK